MEEQFFITFAGLIGSGKTTLAKYLSEYLDLPIYYEAVESNPLLPKFYMDKKKYGFTLQIDLLNRREDQHNSIIHTSKKGIMDRSIYEDQIFAKILYESGDMTQEDYELYIRTSNKRIYNLIKPTCIIFLDVKPEVAFERIKKRARTMEEVIPLEYLTELYKGYIEFINNISKDIFVIRVNWNEFKNLNELSKQIKIILLNRKNIIDIN